MEINGPWTHEQAIVGDVRLHYVAAGDEDDPLVVLLHGFPDFWNTWRNQIPALAEAGYRVIAPDMRGYNRSEKPHGIESYHTDKLVSDVTGLIQHFGREQARVVGHDWGGIVAWEVAIRHPEMVEQVSVLNAPHPGAYRRELGRNPEQWKRSWYAFVFQLPGVPEIWLGARNATQLETLLEDTANPDTFSETDMRRYREAASRPGALTSAINYYRSLFREMLAQEVKGLIGSGGRDLDVEVPTLLLWGEQDSALGIELTEDLGQWVPDLQIERFPESTHWVQHDEADEVSDSLIEFFEEE